MVGLIQELLLDFIETAAGLKAVRARQTTGPRNGPLPSHNHPPVTERPCLARARYRASARLS